MKKKILLLAVAGIVMAIPKVALAQTVEPCTVHAGVVDGGTGASVITVPYDPAVFVAGKTTSSPFTVNLTSGVSANTEWLAAIHLAVATWAQILSTTHPVTVNFYLSTQYMGGIPVGLLATGNPVYDAYGFSSPSPANFPNTYYAGSLACFMSNGGAASGANSNINVIIDPNPSYNTNTDEAASCPLNEYDLTTVIMQAMGHGFGLLSETVYSATVGAVIFAHTNQWLNIYEHFINDNGTGSIAHTITYLKNLGPTSIFLNNFVTGAGAYTTTFDETYSNNAYFKGTTTPLTQLYIPEDYKQGVNLCFLEPSSFNLMSYNLPTGRKIHVPSPNEIKMLNDIGWKASVATVGGLDNVTITGIPLSYSPPNNVLDIGSSYTYYAYDNGGVYGINPSTVSFDLELLDESGWVACASNYGAAEWNTPAIALPSGAHHWIRDIYGNIQGKLTATAMDYESPAVGYSSAMDIGITAAPDKPIFKVKNIEDRNGCCADKTLQFYAAGSQYFQVFSTEYVGGSWDTWSEGSPATGDQSFAFTGLDQTISHKFYVMAFNATGSSISDTITTYPCVYNITPYPNPVINSNVLTLVADQSFLFRNVKIANAQTGIVVVDIHFDGTAPVIKINLSPYNLNPGIYTVTANANNNFNPALCNHMMPYADLEASAKIQVTAP